MTLLDAKRLARILVTADNGCPVCVRALTEQANKEFPEFTWEYNSDAEIIEVRANATAS